MANVRKNNLKSQPSNYGPGYGPGFSSNSSSNGSRSSSSSPSKSGPGSRNSGNRRIIQRNASNKSRSESYYGPGYDPDLQRRKGITNNDIDNGLSSKEIRQINDKINDLNSLKRVLAYDNSENVRNKLYSALKLLQSAQEEIQQYWQEPKEKVNEYLKRIEDQKTLIDNTIKKIDEEILSQIESELSHNQNLLEGD